MRPGFSAVLFQLQTILSRHRGYDLSTFNRHHYPVALISRQWLTSFHLKQQQLKEKILKSQCNYLLNQVGLHSVARDRKPNKWEFIFHSECRAQD